MGKETNNAGGGAKKKGIKKFLSKIIKRGAKTKATNEDDADTSLETQENKEEQSSPDTSHSTPQSASSPRQEQRSVFCPIEPAGVEPVTVHIESPPPASKGKALVSGKAIPKNSQADHIVRPRPLPPGYNVMDRVDHQSRSHFSGSQSTCSSKSHASRSSSSTVTVRSTTSNLRSPCQPRSGLPFASRSSTPCKETNQIPIQHIQPSPFQRNIRAPFRGHPMLGHRADERLKEAQHQQPEDAKPFPANYRGSFNNNEDKQLVHNPVVRKPPPSPRIKPQQQGFVWQTTMNPSDQTLPQTVPQIPPQTLPHTLPQPQTLTPKQSRDPTPQPKPSFSTAKNIFGRIKSQLHNPAQDIPWSSFQKMNSTNEEDRKENTQQSMQSSQQEDSTNDIIPRKKRRPRSSNSMSQQSTRSVSNETQEPPGTPGPRVPTWRSRLSTPFQSTPSIPCENVMDTQQNVKQSHVLSSRSYTAEEWNSQPVDLISNPGQSINIQQTPVLLANQKYQQNQPPVIHYHLNIQNCDGLNIHMNNPENANSEYALDTGGDLDSTLEFGHPIANSTLRAESLALHNHLVNSETDDEESVSDSMAPLNLDETRSDLTGDTTALMDMDAWGAVADSQLSLNKYQQQQTLTDRNKPVRLSQRAQKSTIPPSPVFNPPWRQVSKSDSTKTLSSSSQNDTPGVPTLSRSSSCRSNQSPIRTINTLQTGIMKAATGSGGRSSTNTSYENTYPNSGAQIRRSSSSSKPEDAMASKNSDLKPAPVNTLASTHVASNVAPENKATGADGSPSVPTTESTGTQFPSLSRRSKPLQNRTNMIDLHGQPSSSSKPVAMVAPRARTSSASGTQPSASPRPQQPVNADMDARLVEYLVNNPPDNFSETTDTLSIASEDQFTLTDDDGSPNASFSRFGLASTIQPSLRRNPRGQPHMDDDDSDDGYDQENRPVPPMFRSARRVLTLEERVAAIRNDLVRVPGVLIVSTRRNRIVVFLSQTRPNVEGVGRFMHDHNIARTEFECEVLPWTYRTSGLNMQAQQQMVR